MAPIKLAVHIPGPVYLATMKETAPVDPSHFASVEKAALAMREDLAWWASALREARHKT